jgi:hypothetical protein
MSERRIICSRFSLESIALTCDCFDLTVPGRLLRGGGFFLGLGSFPVLDARLYLRSQRTVQRFCQLRSAGVSWVPQGGTVVTSPVLPPPPPTGTPVCGYYKALN